VQHKVARLPPSISAIPGTGSPLALHPLG